MRARDLIAVLALSMASSVGSANVYPSAPIASGAVCGVVFEGRRAGGDIQVVRDGVYLVAIAPNGGARVRLLPAASQSPEWNEALFQMARSEPVSAGALIRLNRRTQTIEFGRFQLNAEGMRSGGSAIVREQAVSHVFTAGEFLLPPDATTVGGGCVMYGAPRRR